MSGKEQLSQIGAKGVFLALVNTARATDAGFAKKTEEYTESKEVPSRLLSGHLMAMDEAASRTWHAMLLWEIEKVRHKFAHTLKGRQLVRVADKHAAEPLDEELEKQRGQQGFSNTWGLRNQQLLLLLNQIEAGNFRK